MNLESMSDGLLSYTIMSLLGICEYLGHSNVVHISFLVPLECMQ